VNIGWIGVRHPWLAGSLAAYGGRQCSPITAICEKYQGYIARAGSPADIGAQGKLTSITASCLPISPRRRLQSWTRNTCTKI